VVMLRVRGEADAGLSEALREALGAVGIEPAGERLLRLRLERQVDDDRLERLLALVRGRGLAIVGCDTAHFGLMQVLERIEARASDA